MNPDNFSLTPSSKEILDGFFSADLDPGSEHGGSLQGDLTDTIKNSITSIGANKIKVLMLRAAILQSPFLFNRSLDKFYGLLRVRIYNDSLNIDYSEQEVLGLIKSLKKINDFYYNRESRLDPPYGVKPTYEMLRLTAWNSVERASDAIPSDAASGTNISNKPDILMPLVRAYLHDKVNQLIDMIAPDIEFEDDTVLNGLPSCTAWREKDETLSRVERQYHHLTKQMHNDAWYGNTSRFQKYFSQHQVDANSTNSSGKTALMFAAFNGHVDLVKTLLTAGADVNHADQDGKTAMMWAAFNGQVDVVNALFTAGADVNKHDVRSRTALVAAAAYGHAEVVEVLLNRGANIDQLSVHGQTALMNAAANGHLEVVALLLSKGADFNKEDSNGRTALMHAAANGHHEVVALLSNQSSVVNQKKRKQPDATEAPSMAAGDGPNSKKHKPDCSAVFKHNP